MPAPPPPRHVTPGATLAGGQTWGENGALGSYATEEGCFRSACPGWIRPAEEAGGGMRLRRRDLPRSPTEGAQLQAPSAPPPGTGQGSPAGPSRGSSSVTGTRAAAVMNGKKQRLFWKLNLILFAPCLPPGGMVRASPSPLLPSGLPLGSASLCFSRGPGSDCKGPLGRRGRKLPGSVGTGGTSPSVLPCRLARPRAG